MLLYTLYIYMYRVAAATTDPAITAVSTDHLCKYNNTYFYIIFLLIVLL